MLMGPIPIGEDRPMDVDDDKRVAAEAAAEEVVDGMVVGLGTGTTAAHLVPALARRGLEIRCVPTSAATAELARQAGLDVVEFTGIDRIDLAIDGADQVTSPGWLIKGGGGAHTREKIVASAADRFVVIVSSDKLVDRLGPPVPLELLEFGLDATLRLVGRLGSVRLREVPRSPDGGVIADLFGPFDEPAALAAELDAIAGVVDHGLFPPSLVSEVIIGGGGHADHLVLG
jgi:ribose 5-phosphate isomerase A